MKKLLPIFLACSLPAIAADLRLEESKTSMKVLDGDKLVTEYRTDWKVPYLYPLTSTSGAIVSRHWPTDPSIENEEKDHPHHRSVWLGHGLVNGADFWSFKDTKNATIVHNGFSNQGKGTDGAPTFTANLDWIAEGKKLISENRTHTIHKLDDKTLQLDFKCDLTATEDVVFGDTKEGMFAFRMDRTLRLKGPAAKSHIINSEGIADADTWGKRANWIAYYGPDELDQPVVAALFDHPSNFRYPTYWHVRDYGLVSANPFGIHDFENKKNEKTLGDHTLKKGEKLTFKYSIVIHQGDLKSADLNKLWTNFSKN
jgi:hypothetical protein